MRLSSPKLATSPLSSSSASVNTDKNVLLIMQDNSGHGETTSALSPRGILNATLIGNASFTLWKVAGTTGGDSDPIDPARGALPKAVSQLSVLAGTSQASMTQLGTTARRLPASLGAGVKFY